MLFSIIIPAYNEEKSLPGCLESLKNQNLPANDFEVIVIDNGSTDQTPNIVKNYGATLIVNKEKNVSGLRNLGAQMAQGEVLAFIDADCTAASNWLTAASKYINNEKVSAWGGVPGVPDDATWVQKSWYNLRKKTEKVLAVEWLESMNLFVRKSTFLNLGGFNESLVTCEDVDFSYRLGEQGKIIADQDISVLHLGEAATIKAFIRKEFWRGLSNFQGLFSHRLKLSELPSLALPVYFAIFLPLIVLLSIIVDGAYMKYLALAAILLPGIAVWYKLINKQLTTVEILKLQVLLHIYFAVRSVSAFKGLMSHKK